ncbi:MAG: hypothetical protein ACK57V_09370 [Pirellula sp.]
MMHSLFLIVCFGAPAFAQQTTSSLLSSDNPSGNTIHSQTVAPVAESGYGNSHFSQPACNGPYSQLGAKMNCSDASPNLWCGYAAERAALAAKVMKHVDMQCGCCAAGGCSTLHSAPCESGCGETGCAGKDRAWTTKAVKINRYKEPFSSLYADPCVQCSSGKCRLGQRLHNTLPGIGCNSCNSCNSCEPQAAVGYSGQSHCSSCASISAPAASMSVPGSMAAPVNNTVPGNHALANRIYVQPNPINVNR